MHMKTSEKRQIMDLRKGEKKHMSQYSFSIFTPVYNRGGGY